MRLGIVPAHEKGECGQARRKKHVKQSPKRMKRVVGGPNTDSLWKALVVLTMGGLLFAGAAAAVDGAETTKAADAATSRTFNVHDYGAVGDDKTDNTEAFSACLKAVIEADRLGSDSTGNLGEMTCHASGDRGGWFATKHPRRAACSREGSAARA